MGQFFSNLLSGIGNVVFAIIILILALIIASVVKSLVLKALKALKFDQQLAKLGINDATTNSALTFIGKLVWFVVFLMFLPGVFSKLGLSSITSPITSLVSTFIGYIPKIIAAGIIIAVGVFAADLVKQILVPVLKATKIDSLQKSLGLSAKTTLSALIADIAKYLLILFFAVQAINALELSVLSRVGSTIINYVPAVLASIIIVIVAILAGKALENVIVKAAPKAKGFAVVAKIIVYIFAGFMVLSQLGFSSTIINTAFTLILASVCVAAAIAFGIGGRDFAKHQLDKLEKKIDDNL
jgi:hypothetical protein